jgi:hypothetical protein
MDPPARPQDHDHGHGMNSNVADTDAEAKKYLSQHGLCLTGDKYLCRVT